MDLFVLDEEGAAKTLSDASYLVEETNEDGAREIIDGAEGDCELEVDEGVVRVLAAAVVVVLTLHQLASFGGEVFVVSE